MGRQERHGLEHGFFRAQIKRRKNHEESRRADEELKDFQRSTGEPSKAFFPPSLPGEENIIFLADKLKKRKESQRRERETVATPQDIANRIREQLERYIELEHYAGHPAKLPPEWRRIGIKYWDEIQALKGDSITLSSAEPSPTF